MSYHNFESFDITRQVEQYSGKKLEDLFQNQTIIRNEMGEFVELVWKEPNFSCELNLQMTKRKILYNLKTVYFIGEHFENYLTKRGIKNLIDLKFHLKYTDSANKILNLIKKRDYETLCKNRYINDLDVIFCFELEDLLFLDIETLGIYDSPMIIVGLGFFRNNQFQIHILFARELEEEIAICEHLKNEILPNFKCFITYNGKSFDIPYIANRLLYYFDENPMIFEDDIPYKHINTKYHHIDLYHNCRRKYKGMYYDYTLTNIEKKLLSWTRDNDLPSNLVGMCYRKYLKDPIRYIGLVKDIIEHNYTDIYSLPLILQKMLED